MRILLTSYLLAFFFLSCKDNESSSNKSTIANDDLLSSHLDTTVHPGDDFFSYANGGWLKRNPIPKSENGWGIFNLVAEENYTQIKKISEDASAVNAPKGSPQQQIGDFFFAGMDSSSIEAANLGALESQLKRINDLKDNNELMHTISELQMSGVPSAYALTVGQDMKNSEKNMVYLSQGGLGLPDRDYYFSTDLNTKKIRDAYLKHVSSILYLFYLDSNKAAKNAASILQLETTLAAAHKKLENLRDPYANYHKMGVEQLNKSYPRMNWSGSIEQMKLGIDSVIVGQPAFFEKLNNLIGTTSLDTWKTYLTWELISSYAPYLGSKFVSENFNFYQKTINGTKEMRPRWKRVLDAQENALGDAMGQLFVKTYFPEKTKKRYEHLVEQIVISYQEHIEKLDWMGDSTKKMAIKKLNAITKKIGYPLKWKDYSSMSISRTSYCQNVLESNKWRFSYQAAKLKKPVDRSEWDMTPQTYNAYYNPSNNEIVLPAAIFTAPGYRDEDIDDAVIYGYVGASTIGHELTHGFDDQGRQFDEKGNLKNWWNKEDEIKFKAKANKLVEQFNQYVVLDSLHPNGLATLGENIADLGGIVIALDAFKKTKQYKEGKSISGLTPLQRYFMGYAYGWMQTRTPERLASILLTDVHAPIFLRVNGPMSNCDEWYKEFNVTAAHKMYRDSASRVRIW